MWRPNVETNLKVTAFSSLYIGKLIGSTNLNVSKFTGKPQCVELRWIAISQCICIARSAQTAHVEFESVWLLNLINPRFKFFFVNLNTLEAETSSSFFSRFTQYALLVGSLCVLACILALRSTLTVAI